MIVGAALVYALGWALDRGLRLGRGLGPARVPLRFVAALVALYLATCLAPLLGIAVVAAYVTRRRVGAARGERARGALPVLAALGAWFAIRPAAPLYWDEFVWLAKPRLAGLAPAAFVDEVLRQGSFAIPHGYPVLAATSVAALSGFAVDPPTLFDAAQLFALVAAATFVLLADGDGRPRALLALSLVACPLFLVHVRSAYLDVPVGLGAASVLVALERRAGRAAAVLAVFLVGMKDEGVVHLVAVAGTSATLALRDGRGGDARRALGALAAGALAFVGWRVRLAVAGVSGLDHAVEVPALARVPTVLATLGAQALESTSLGALFGVALGAAVVGLAAPATSPTTRRPWVFVADLATLPLGLLLAPERVMDFLRAGTLASRMLLQTAPLAALVVTGALVPRARPR